MTHTATIAFPDRRHRVQIGDLEPDMFVRVHCEACAHMAEFDARTCRGWGSAETPIHEVVPKLRCRNCGQRGTRFWDAWRKG